MPKPLTTMLGIGFVTLLLFGVENATSLAMPTINFSADQRAAGTFPESWIHGSKSAMDNTDPAVQVHAYNDHTWILRENKAINYEGAFMYLLFGNNKVMLIDQGSTSSPVLFPLRKVVDDIIAAWETKHKQDNIQLIVANSHLHGDHYAAWNQFVGRPNTLMVGLTHEEVMDFWGFSNYPAQRLTFDLGGRKLIVTGTPGHQSSEIAFYDTWTDLLYTGDMFYRGRLYLEDWAAWKASIKRLDDMATDYPVSHLINNHIEMTNKPGIDYPIGTTWQPEEPPMQMTVAMLKTAVEATAKVTGPGIYSFDTFLIYNEIPWAYTTDP
ncbi:MAG: MBL fold metallo-hydrolase [Pseudomonadales bacterium]|jgi:glyoxylase-like metal-dependent hydrolase (beta-lactamase superfamily II)|nr:MBL fold metallo-hydrolase [Pseudomonadales bacterium]MDP4639772.1 MBL fold metallo-hydrolase [Pseudomonadales bacterium]MDP4765074.1 MBL fold metallo-hydrolase [Pseudomonadales bacterium]MDP5058438.1 MBL fold metallo-hydrolase [Pseudomonadales bacterium]